jgi:hypothetical protein
MKRKYLKRMIKKKNNVLPCVNKIILKLENYKIVQQINLKTHKTNKLFR